MSINTQMLQQIEEAITKLLNGDQAVSIATTDSDGTVNRVEYSVANMKDLLNLKAHYEGEISTMNIVEMEVVP